MLENLFKKVRDGAEHEYGIEVGGMKCENCAKRVISLLKKIPGIENAVASVGDGRIDIAASLPIAKETVEKVIREAGFEFNGFIQKK